MCNRMLQTYMHKQVHAHTFTSHIASIAFSSYMFTKIIRAGDLYINQDSDYTEIK